VCNYAKTHSALLLLTSASESKDSMIYVTECTVNSSECYNFAKRNTITIYKCSDRALGGTRA